jgi:hypothetical protein
VLVPYWKYQVVARPLGSTVPVSVADVAVIAPAGPVLATGLAEVEKIPSAPRVVPALLVATSR